MAAETCEDVPKRTNARNAKKTKNKKRGKNKAFQWIWNNVFIFSLVLSTVLGYVLGLYLQSVDMSKQTIFLIGFPGQLVLRAFLMIIVPLLFCSLVLGVSSLRKGGDAIMVAITIGFFLALSTFAAVMGATAGHVVHPGQKITSREIQPQSELSGRKGVILDSVLDLFWNAIPGNIIEATFQKDFTHVEVQNVTGDGNFTIIYKKSIMKKEGVNFMGLLTFSILFGCALAALGDKGDALHEVLEQINSVIMKIMQYFLNCLPVGMFFWMFREGLESSAPVQLLGYLGTFLATAMGCILFHQFVLLPGLYILIVRKNPIPYHVNLLPAILTAFGTSSSAATMPSTLQCAEEVNRVNRCVTRFVIPLGMVVHMNGGTFYSVLSSLFLAQLEGIEVGIIETCIMCITSILLYIAAPGTAGGTNPVYILTVMAAAGINKPQFISLVLSMEWIMERFRTVMNVVADSYVAAFVEKLCSKRLPPDYSDIQYTSPVLDGYNHPPTSEPRCPTENTNGVEMP